MLYSILSQTRFTRYCRTLVKTNTSSWLVILSWAAIFERENKHIRRQTHRFTLISHTFYAPSPHPYTPAPFGANINPVRPALAFLYFFFFFFQAWASMSFEHISTNCAFDIFQKVVFCLALYTELNLQTFVMIWCKTICRNYLCIKIILVIGF